MVKLKTMSDKYTRPTQTTVTIFIHHQNKYLFIKRNKNKKIQPGKLNGIGGRVEYGENYVDAVIREVAEETGFKISNKDITFSGLGKFEDEGDNDFIIAYFKVQVASEVIPNGGQNEDGTLHWIAKEKIQDTEYEKVYTIDYFLKDLLNNRFFIINGIPHRGKINISYYTTS
jgi:8-oxo-dGTP pyrophosphatase MutT (NUDIX family)